jgi:hypothetical protein
VKRAEREMKSRTKKIDEASNYARGGKVKRMGYADGGAISNKEREALQRATPKKEMSPRQVRDVIRRNQAGPGAISDKERAYLQRTNPGALSGYATGGSVKKK